MGAGASSNAIQANNFEATKPLDASDINDLAQAKFEIARLRQLSHFYRNQTLNGVPVDLTGDGKPNAIGYDTNGDGVIDSLDMKGSGYATAKLVNNQLYMTNPTMSVPLSQNTTNGPMPCVPVQPNTVVLTPLNAPQPAVTQSVVGQPMMGQPMMGQPMTGQPMTGQPMMGQPMMGQPMMAQPVEDQHEVVEDPIEQPDVVKEENTKGSSGYSTGTVTAAATVGAIGGSLGTMAASGLTAGSDMIVDNLGGVADAVGGVFSAIGSMF